MEELRSTSRRLTKKPPLAHQAYSHSSDSTTNSRLDNTSIRSQSSSNSLQRAPSAPYPRSHNNNTSGHVRTLSALGPAAYGSSNSSLDRQIGGPSPILAANEFDAPSGQSGGKRHSNPPPRGLLERSTVDFIGAPFDGSGILNQIDSSKAPAYQGNLRRPPPPPLSHTSPLPQAMNPPLRQSASFTAGDRINEKMPARVAENQLISPKRYSDETKEPKSVALRKKTGFSGFMNSLVGSPRRINISAPENPVHVTHVGYDNDTGKFIVSRSVDDILRLKLI